MDRRHRPRPEPSSSRSRTSFPGGTVDSGDFRDQMCRRFAAELAKRTNGALTAEVYPGSSLVKTVAQYSAIRRGALDMTLYPLNYAGGEVERIQYRLHAGRHQLARPGLRLEEGRDRQAPDRADGREGRDPRHLAVAGRRRRRAATHPILVPEDVKGLKVRGGSREMDLMLKGAGAARGQHAVERALRRHADRHDGRRHDLARPA